jgi:hypothetical protein
VKCEFDLTKVRTSILTFICLSKKESPTPTNTHTGINQCRGSRHHHTGNDDLNNWHLTIKCTLLSSQGPDTTRTQPNQWFSEKPICRPLALSRAVLGNLSSLTHYSCVCYAIKKPAAVASGSVALTRNYITRIPRAAQLGLLSRACRVGDTQHTPRPRTATAHTPRNAMRCP